MEALDSFPAGLRPPGRFIRERNLISTTSSEFTCCIVCKCVCLPLPLRCCCKLHHNILRIKIDRLQKRRKKKKGKSQVGRVEVALRVNSYWPFAGKCLKKRINEASLDDSYKYNLLKLQPVHLCVRFLSFLSFFVASRNSIQNVGPPFL